MGSLKQKVGQDFNPFDEESKKFTWVFPNRERRDEIYSHGILYPGKNRDELILFTSGDKVVNCLETVTGKIIWRYEIGEGVTLTHPIILRGENIFLLTNKGTLRVINMRFRQILWEKEIKFPLKYASIGKNSLLLCAAIEKESYYGTSRMLAMSFDDGSVFWEKGINVITPPVMFGNAVFLNTSSGFIYTLSMKDGGVFWKHNRFLAKGTFDMIAYGSTLYVAEKDLLYALNMRGGDVIWKHKSKSEVCPEMMLFEKSLFIITMNGEVYSIDIENGSLRWSYCGPEINPSKDKEEYCIKSIIVDRILIICRSDCFITLNIDNGNLIYSKVLNKEVLINVPRPIIAEGTVVFTNGRKSLYWYNKEDIETVNTYELIDDTSGVVFLKQYDGKVLIMTKFGSVYCIDLKAGISTTQKQLEDLLSVSNEVEKVSGGEKLREMITPQPPGKVKESVGKTGEQKKSTVKSLPAIEVSKSMAVAPKKPPTKVPVEQHLTEEIPGIPVFGESQYVATVSEAISDKKESPAMGFKSALAPEDPVLISISPETSADKSENPVTSPVYEETQLDWGTSVSDEMPLFSVTDDNLSSVISSEVFPVLTEDDNVPLVDTSLPAEVQLENIPTTTSLSKEEIPEARPSIEQVVEPLAKGELVEELFASLQTSKTAAQVDSGEDGDLFSAFNIDEVIDEVERELESSKIEQMADAQEDKVSQSEENFQQKRKTMQLEEEFPHIEEDFLQLEGNLEKSIAKIKENQKENSGQIEEKRDEESFQNGEKVRDTWAADADISGAEEVVGAAEVVGAEEVVGAAEVVGAEEVVSAAEVVGAAEPVEVSVASNTLFPNESIEKLRKDLQHLRIIKEQWAEEARHLVCYVESLKNYLRQIEESQEKRDKQLLEKIESLHLLVFTISEQVSLSAPELQKIDTLITHIAHIFKYLQSQARDLESIKKTISTSIQNLSAENR